MSRAFTHLDSPRLFPTVAAHCSIGFLQDEADWEGEFGLQVPAALAKAVPKRRRDYLAGRYCADQALRVVAPDLAGSAIEIGGGREPVWPRGIVGSITHTHGFVSAVVARSSDLAAVGIDSERERGASAMAGIERHIISASELAALKDSGLPVSLHTLLAFSAKEAVFKCLYPRARQMWELDEVQVEHVDVVRHAFRARAASARAAAAWPASGVDGRFAIRDGCVHTGASVLTFGG